MLHRPLCISDPFLRAMGVNQTTIFHEYYVVDLNKCETSYQVRYEVAQVSFGVEIINNLSS